MKTALALLATVLLLQAVTAKDDEKKFQAALDSCSDACKLVVATCMTGNAKAASLAADSKFCDLVTLVDGSFNMKSCVTPTGGCTQDEYNKVKDAACGATSLVVSMAAVVVGVFASLIKNL